MVWANAAALPDIPSPPCDMEGTPQFLSVLALDTFSVFGEKKNVWRSHVALLTLPLALVQEGGVGDGGPASKLNRIS